MTQLHTFVLDRLAEDERRFASGELPLIDVAERRGRIRVMRTDDGDGLLIAADPVETPEERAPVPFEEKAALIRREAAADTDHDVLGLVASVYDAHPDWLEAWRPTSTA
ncbi:hypothetical protein [Actinophytocola gossypii]|uniref:Uncharacterized protein n=1 Tax=Actinophytocola gossypii TaxID=2812003 RepID=A0ABT2J109_9PSEU|nr:hypothetical protein [Actinophytocola gossypii]MCT2581549.1 hypothetical protein [Actinophytocola gossypii]